MPMQTLRRTPLTMNLLALSLLACAPFAWADDAATPQDTPSATPQQAQA